MVEAAVVARWREELLACTDDVCRDQSDADRSGAGRSDADRVDVITELERLKNTIAAAQADLTVALDASQRTEQARAGVPAARLGRGVAAQVGLARQTSPHRGRVLLGLAKALATELPHTREALRAGVIDEFTATLVASETACLAPEQRLAVDRDVLGRHRDLEGAGTRRIVGQVRAATQKVDPAAVVRRASNARRDRHVSLRPAPDTMTWLTALVPVEDGVAAYAALKTKADTARAEGDPRSRGQVMADTLVEHVTGRAPAEGVDVCVDLVLSDDTLLGAGHEPAQLLTAGAPTQQVPAQVAREIVGRALDSAAQAWVRRLYADPAGHLVALTSKQRFHRDGLAEYLRLRDQGLCRNPWCNAPVRHLDHPEGAGAGTSHVNGQGLCEACNQAKEALGWRSRTIPADTSASGRHEVEITTPTGHRHHSTAPPTPTPARRTRARPPGQDRRHRPRRLSPLRASPLEIRFDLAAFERWEHELTDDHAST